MTDNSSIDLSLTNIWRSWRAFRLGKKRSRAVVLFESELERKLLKLCADLNNGSYQHEHYGHRIINDNKRRDIVVASVRDRVVHRLLYDYLVSIWDKTFVYDVWSCRKNKGLHRAVDRAQSFMENYRGGWVWRADVVKFFDSINQNTMKQLLRRRIHDPQALWLLDEVIGSYNVLSKQASKQASKACQLAI